MRLCGAGPFRLQNTPPDADKPSALLIKDFDEENNYGVNSLDESFIMGTA